MQENRRDRIFKGRCRGQVVAEYSAIMTMALFIIVIMVFLLAVFTEYGWRVLSLIGDFPYSNY